MRYTIVKAWLYQSLESGISVMSLGDKDQRGLSYRLHYRETCTPTSAEHDFWVIPSSQPVQVDQLVSYPLVLIHPSLNVPKPFAVQ